MAPASLFTGKTLEEAVRKGLEALGISRAEAMITVIEEGSGGFLGFGSRPYRVRMLPRPGGAMREPDDREPRDRSTRRDRGGERGGERGGRGRGGERGGERAPRGRGGERPAAPVAAAGERAPRGRGEERRSSEVRSDERRPAARPQEERRAEARGGGERVREAGRGRGEERRGPRPEERRPAERPAQPARITAPAEPPEPRAPQPMEVAADGGDEGRRRRRRRGRRGGRGRGGVGRVGEDGNAVPSVGLEEPMDVRSPGMMPVHEQDYDDAPVASEPRIEPRREMAFEARREAPVEPRREMAAEARYEAPVEPRREMAAEARYEAPAEPRREIAAEPRGYSEHDAEPVHASADDGEHTMTARPAREPRGAVREPREPRDNTPALSSDALAASGKRWTEDLLKAMGFDASVSATADGERVDVVAEVTSDDELLNGPKGEVRQALQHLLNRMVNLGEGSRYHLQLEINDFWKRREDELRELALQLAEQAITSQGEVVTEYLNAQERRIIHVTLRDDTRVKTYALGDGMIKRLAVAPAGFPEGGRAE